MAAVMTSPREVFALELHSVDWLSWGQSVYGGI